MNVDLIFTHRPRNLASWLIKKLLRTKYSHVAIQIRARDKEPKIYHSSMAGVERLTTQQFLKKNKVVYKKTLNIPVTSIADIVRYCKSMLGRPYGYLTILGIFLEVTFGILNKIGEDGNRTLICSEFAARALKKALPFKASEIHDMTPKELYVLTRSIS
jgi:hypothetical protein